MSTVLLVGTSDIGNFEWRVGLDRYTLQYNIDRALCARTRHSLQRGNRLDRHATPAGVNFGYVPI